MPTRCATRRRGWCSRCPTNGSCGCCTATDWTSCVRTCGSTTCPGFVAVLHFVTALDYPGDVFARTERDEFSVMSMARESADSLMLAALAVAGATNPEPKSVSFECRRRAGSTVGGVLTRLRDIWFPSRQGIGVVAHERFRARSFGLQEQPL